MFAVVALDIDGTVLRSDGSVSERTTRVLDRCVEAGMKVVIATARPPRMIPWLLPECLCGLPCVCYNGAEVYEAGQRVAACHMEPEVAREIVRSVNAVSPVSAVSVEVDDWNYCDRVIESRWPYDVVELMGFIDRPVAKVIFDSQAIEDRESLALGLPRECVCKFTSRGAVGEVVAASASKAAGLAALVARWSMSLRDVIAFGDDLPDVEMLRDCGMGVAMANAASEVKSVADRLTLSNDQDGVAVVLEEMLEMAHGVSEEGVYP